ncbi:DUF2029 domain-containing protein [Sphingomonas koreensis]|nr:DUF2029 domain-containing protein [Sphingomonas koreensis]
MNLQRHAVGKSNIIFQSLSKIFVAPKIDLSFSDLPFAYRLVGKTAVILGMMLLIYDAYYLFTPGLPLPIADKDFANYWMSAHLAATGDVRTVFGSQAIYLDHLRAVFGQKMPWHNWSYPPHYLLLMMPLALVPYKIGLVVFIFLTGYFFCKAYNLFCESKSMLPIAIVAPFILLNTWEVQNGFLTGGLALLVLRLRENRPIVAGICLGLLTIKPQLGFLFPILLLVERRWLVLSSAALTTCFLIALSALIFGIEAWKAYLSIVIPFQGLVMTELGGKFLTMLPSTYGAARLYGASADSALLIHSLIAIPVAILTVVAVFATRSARARDYLVLTATFLITPYSLNYDLGMLAAGVASFIADGGDNQRKLDRVLLALVMLLPVSMMIVGRLGIAVGPPLLLITFAAMIHRADIWDRVGGWLGSFRRHPGRVAI